MPVLQAAPTINGPDKLAAPELSIVMPCLNEARTVGRCIDKALRAFQELGITGEVLVADNGSTDGSPDIARVHGARVVAVERRGYGSALQGGIAAACGRYVIMGDADDSYDFGQLGPFLDCLRHGDDLVMGNRFQGGIRPGAMSWLHRYVGNPALTGILNLFFRSNIGDAHCGLRGFRMDAYQRLGLSKSVMEFASEMVVKASLHRLRISEVPVVLHPDGRDRPPHLRSFRDGWRHLRFLLLFCPRWLYFIPATLLLTIGLCLMVWLTPGPLSLGNVVLDCYTMLLGSMCVLLGYQTLWLGASAKAFGRTSGLLSRDARPPRGPDHPFLDRCLMGGLLLFLVGLGLNLWLVHEWYRCGPGPLDLQSTLRYALWGFTSMVMGAQTIYSSFFLGLLGMGSVSPNHRWEMAPSTTGPHCEEG
ncbi:MAG: glycosyltransferase family 2 protein [Gemmataceae bacterium]